MRLRSEIVGRSLVAEERKEMTAFDRARAFAGCAACLMLVASARADDQATREGTDPTALFQAALDSLASNRPNEAIAKLEALADRGVVDAALAYDRGLAYAARVRSGGEHPGDLGRAAHGFEEARELTRDAHLAADATSALAIVRAEIARRRARAGDPVEIDSGFSLGRSIVELLPENAWATVGALAAFVLSLAILVRSRATLPRLKVAATTTGALAGGLLAIASLLAFTAREIRHHLRDGVVVTPNARILDAQHRALDSVAPIPEGVRARIDAEGGDFVHVVVGGAEGFLPSSAVLPLAKR